MFDGQHSVLFINIQFYKYQGRRESQRFRPALHSHTSCTKLHHIKWKWHLPTIRFGLFHSKWTYLMLLKFQQDRTSVTYWTKICHNILRQPSYLTCFRWEKYWWSKLCCDIYCICVYCCLNVTTTWGWWLQLARVSTPHSQPETYSCLHSR